MNGLAYLSEVDSIFNLGQVGQCTTLSRYVKEAL